MDSFSKRVKAGDFQVKKFKRRAVLKAKKFGGSVLNGYEKNY